MNWKDKTLSAEAEEFLSNSLSVEEAVESGKWLNLVFLGRCEGVGVCFVLGLLAGLFLFNLFVGVWQEGEIHLDVVNFVCLD